MASLSCFDGLCDLCLSLGSRPQRCCRLRGLRVVVTGASEGIGVAIAQTLVSKDVGVTKIALAARRKEKLLEVAESLERSNGVIKVMVLEADVSKIEDCQSIADRVLGEWGGCDLLVNNAGIPGVAHFEHATADLIDKVLDVNLRGAMQLTRFFLPSMKEVGRGHVVNVASLAGKGIEPYNSIYAASKYGIVGWSHALRAEMRLKRSGVTVHVVAPGFVSDAGMAAGPSSNLHIDEIFEKAMQSGGSSTPSEVADAVVRAVEFDEPELVVNSNYTPWRFARKTWRNQLFPRRPDSELAQPSFAPVLAWLRAVADGNLRKEQQRQREDASARLDPFFKEAARNIRTSGAVAVGGTGDAAATTVRQVIIVHRHGARLPTSGICKDDLSWPASLAFWDSYAGQVTPVGCQQLINLGAALRERYGIGAVPGCLGGPLAGIPREQVGLHVVAYCSNFQRTLFSAWSLLQGLLPEVPHFFCSRSERVLLDPHQLHENYYGKGGTTTMGIPIVVQEKDSDRLLRQWEYADKGIFKKWQSANQNKGRLAVRLVDAPDGAGAALTDKLWKMTGMYGLDPEGCTDLRERIKAIKKVQTQIEIAEGHGNPIIPNEAGLELTASDRELIEQLSDEQKHLWFCSADSNLQADSKGVEAAGHLAHLIWWHIARMEDANVWRSKERSQSETSEHGPPMRIVEFSAHDTTVMALATRLGVTVKPPKFGGYFLFEVHEGGVINCMYNPDPSRISLDTLTPRQLPFSAEMQDIDALPAGPISLSALKAHCQIATLKFTARRLRQLLGVEMSQRLLEATELVDGIACEANSRSGGSQPWLGRNDSSFMDGLDQGLRTNAEEAFDMMDQAKSGKVSLGNFAALMAQLGVQVPPRTLSLVAKGFGCEGGAWFDRRGFVTLMALLDQDYLQE